MKNLEHSLGLGMLAPVYLFVGDETLLMEEYIDRIAALTAPEGGEWGRETLHGDETTPQDAVAALDSGGLFCSRRLVVVRDAPWFGKRRAKAAEEEGEPAPEKEGKIDPEPLIRYCADPNPDAVLVLTAASAPKNTRLYKALAAAGRVAEFPLYKAWEREAWLTAYLKRAGRQPEAGVAEYVSLLSGEGLLALKGEADKLVLYSEGRNRISAADAEAVISATALSGVFDLTDAAAERDGAKAVTILRRLLRQGQAAQYLLVMVASQYRNILLVKDMLRLGFSQGDAAGRLGVHPFTVKKSALSAQKYNYKQLMKAIDVLLAADIAGKSGGGDPAQLLENAIMRICLL